MISPIAVLLREGSESSSSSDAYKIRSHVSLFLCSPILPRCVHLKRDPDERKNGYSLAYRVKTSVRTFPLLSNFYCTIDLYYLRYSISRCYTVVFVLICVKRCQAVKRWKTDLVYLNQVILRHVSPRDYDRQFIDAVGAWILLLLVVWAVVQLTRPLRQDSIVDRVNKRVSRPTFNLGQSPCETLSESILIVPLHLFVNQMKHLILRHCKPRRFRSTRHLMKTRVIIQQWIPPLHRGRWKKVWSCRSSLFGGMDVSSAVCVMR